MSRTEAHRPFTEHLAECSDCRSDHARIEALSARLAEGTVVLDASELSRRALTSLAVELESNAAEVLWRRVVTALVLAVAPLPLVLVWDAYLLSGLHSLLHDYVPGPVATYVTFSYTALLALLLAGTYAAIPLSFGRLRAHGLVALGRSPFAEKTA